MPSKDHGLIAFFRILAGELLVALKACSVFGHAGPGRKAHPFELTRELFALAAFLLFLECEPGLFLFEPRRVVSFPGNALAPVELEYPFGDVIEEVAIVGDEHDGAGVFLEVALEPGDAFGVEMVGGLIQEQEVGALEQDFAKGDAPAFAAREGGNVCIAGGQAHGVHGDFDTAIEIPALGGFDGVLDLGLLFEECVHFVGVGAFGEAVVDLVEAREMGANVRDGDLDITTHIA
jgi:hypothetical protein